MSNTKINVAEIRKTYDTTGSVRYLMVFQASEGFYTVMGETNNVDTQYIVTPNPDSLDSEDIEYLYATQSDAERAAIEFARDHMQKFYVLRLEYVAEYGRD